MSAAEEIVEQAIPGLHADAGELKARRRAKSIVHEALLAAGTPLDNRGLKHRLLPGLWNAAMNVLIACMEPSDVLAVLTDRQRGIVGNGDNADSPPRTVPQKSMQAYCDEVAQAGETIMECLMKGLDRLEGEGLGDRFPETVLDSALIVLLGAWGPDHVRRAMTEQSALIIRGVSEPVNFMEPVHFMPPPAHKSDPRLPAEPSKPAPAETQEQPHATPVAAPRRVVASRNVSACVMADLSAGGKGAWAVHLRSFGDDRQEDRLISGTKHDPNGRTAWLAALHECVLAICCDVEKAQGKIEMTSEEMVRAASGAPGTRLKSEEQVWSDIDSALALHDISIRQVEASLSRADMERCDRQIQSLLAV